MGEESSAPSVVPSGESTGAVHISSNADQRPLGMPALGGLFAGGMPTLKKSAGISTGRDETSSELHDSRRESTDWFGRLASHSPAEENASGTAAVSMPAIQELASVSPAVSSAFIADHHTLSTPSKDSIHSTTSPASLANAENSVDDKVDFDRGYRAKSLWAYSAGAADQLSFMADEYLLTYPSKESSNTDWVYGVSEKNSALKGWFPKDYVQQVEGNFLSMTSPLFACPAIRLLHFLTWYISSLMSSRKIQGTSFIRIYCSE